MAGFAIGKLEKMKVSFLTDLGAASGIPFPIQYNPSKFSVTNVVCYDDTPVAGVIGNIDQKFINKKGRVLNMDLDLDGTGASPSGSIVSLNTGNKVSKLVDEFLKNVHDIDGGEHKPHYISVAWGSFFIKGVVTDVQVSYSLFGRDGNPLRGKISVTVKEAEKPQTEVAKTGAESSDITKSITVVEGDTIYNLCAKEYGNPVFYTQIAEVNNLNNYRKLKPGMRLLFPPLKQEV